MRRPGRFDLSAADAALIVVLTAFGGVVRAVHLTRPRSFFDEGFYAPDACWYVHRSASLCGQAAEVTREHPPLAKWLIGGGIELFGFTSTGWRIAALLAGTLTIPLLYLLARRLLGSSVGATVAAGLLAIDFLHFVHSRMAMLDVFVTLFGVCAVLFAVYDRDQLRAGARRAGPIGRPWRLAAGVSAGAAAASKWSGVSVLAVILLLSVVWECAQRGGASRLRRAVSEEWRSLAGCLLLTPLAVYVASYADLLSGTLATWPWSSHSWLRAFLRRQHYMLHAQAHVPGAHPYESPPWAWPLVRRPVVYFFQARDGHYREVLALGSPLVWWSSIAALGHLVLRLLRGFNPWGAELVISVAVAGTFLPWFAVALQREQVFLFYLLPTVPFMCLALGQAAARLWTSTIGRVVTSAFALGAVALLVVYYPLLTARPLSPHAWRERLLFRDCPASRPSMETHARPPRAWCWI